MTQQKPWLDPSVKAMDGKKTRASFTTGDYYKLVAARQKAMARRSAAARSLKSSEPCQHCHIINLQEMTFDLPYCGGCLANKRLTTSL